MMIVKKLAQQVLFNYKDIENLDHIVVHASDDKCHFPTIQVEGIAGR